MLKKIKYHFRAVSKNKATLATNIAGLSIGLATTILLLVFMLHEWSYDRHFENADNIYRLHSVWEEGGQSSVQPINLRQSFTEIPKMWLELTRQSRFTGVVVLSLVFKMTGLQAITCFM
jgi:putative ABC transport system permease protein